MGNMIAGAVISIVSILIGFNLGRSTYGLPNEE